MKKVLIIGKGSIGLNPLLIQKFKEDYGEDVKIYTSEEALKEGLNEMDFDNIPTYKFEAPPKLEPLMYFTGGRVGKGGRARNRSANRNKFHK